MIRLSVRGGTKAPAGVGGEHLDKPWKLPPPQVGFVSGPTQGWPLILTPVTCSACKPCKTSAPMHARKKYQNALGNNAYGMELTDTDRGSRR